MLIIFCLGLILTKVSALKVFLVLGCGMEWLQHDRVSTALTYWSSQNIPKDETIWYLSGGVKNAMEKFNTLSSSTEAERMGRSFSGFFGDRVVLDTGASNTAENFRNFFKFVEDLNLQQIQEYEIVIVTSAFHKTRAEKFFYGFFPQLTHPKWVLAPLECSSCAGDELFHMKNVESDIAKAKSSKSAKSILANFDL